MPQLSTNHAKFIEGFCTHGDQIKAYMDVYPKASATTARVKASVLLKRQDVREGIKELSDMMDRVRMQADDIIKNKAAERLTEKLVGMVFTADQKKDILRQIATGELREKTYKPVWEDGEDGQPGKWVSKLVAISEPTMADRIRAIETHNKMTGDNAPEKLEHSLGKGVDDYILEE